MVFKSIEEVMGAVRHHLVPFLREHGINTEHNFMCMNPDHRDSNPSMTVSRDETGVYCYGCGKLYDIFSVAHYLDGRPLDGADFIKDNVLYLADRYGFKYESKELAPEELHRAQAQRAYLCAAGHVKAFWDVFQSEKYPKIAEEIAHRNWSPAILRELGIGSIADAKRLKSSLNSQGFDDAFLQSIDLNVTGGLLFTRPDSMLLFTYYNEHGQPVGFMGRNLNYKKGAEFSKFTNSSDANPIFVKGDCLYNIQNVKRKTNTAFLVEGPPDAITMYHNGIKNVLALGSTSLSAGQLTLLRKHGVNDVIIALDGDSEGLKAVERMLDKTLAGCYDLSIRILEIPDGKDPDEYIRLNGIQAFRSLPLLDAFAWRLNRMPKEWFEDISKIEPLVKLILNEPSWIRRHKMCKTLATKTGVTEKFIRSEVERLADLENYAIEAKRNEIIRDLVSGLQKNPKDGDFLIEKAQQNLAHVSDTQVNLIDPASSISAIAAIKEFNYMKDGTLPGLDTGYKLFNELTGGIPIRDSLCCFGGIPNSGKTSFIAALTYNLMRLNPDTFFLVHTTDDTTAQFIPRLVAQFMRHKGLTIRGIDNPNFFYPDRQEMRDAIEEGYQEVFKLISEERFDIKDVSAARNAKTVGFGEDLIRRYRAKWPDRNIVYVLDNFHKCDDFATLDERIRYKRMIGMVKDTCQKHHVTGICTVEYNKIDDREPKNNDISETGRVLYDANLVFHVHNDLNARRDQAKYVWLNHMEKEDILTNEGVRLVVPKRKPILKVLCGKTKVNEDKQSIYFKMDPSTNSVDELTLNETETLVREAQSYAANETLFG